MSNSNEMKNLPIGPIDITRPEIRCYSIVKNIKCKYFWTILKYTSAVEKSGTVLKSPTDFSPTNDKPKWFLELRCSKVRNNANANQLNLYLKPYRSSSVTQNGLISAELKFSVIDSDGQECNIKKENFLLSSNTLEYGFYKFIEDDSLLQNKNKLFPQNNLTIYCEVIFTKQENIIDDYDQNSSILPEPNESNLEEFGTLFNNKDYSDLTIYVNGKEYPAHKSILAGRSPVFAAMLKHDMKETQQNRIDIKDIDEEVFVEALRYIYTGKVQNLETLAFELLPVADKYDLEKLKIMCGKVLYQKLSVKTAVKILILADTHNVENLKNHVIKYIRAYSFDVVKKVDADTWNDLTSRSLLVKDVLLACLK